MKVMAATKAEAAFPEAALLQTAQAEEVQPETTQEVEAAKESFSEPQADTVDKLQDEIDRLQDEVLELEKWGDEANKADADVLKFEDETNAAEADVLKFEAEVAKLGAEVNELGKADMEQSGVAANVEADPAGTASVQHQKDLWKNWNKFHNMPSQPVHVLFEAFKFWHKGEAVGPVGAVEAVGYSGWVATIWGGDGQWNCYFIEWR